MTYAFPRSHRLSGQSAFASVYAARAREVRGPLVLQGMPNGLAYCRLGLSVGRGVGIAARRNRIKRLLREAFRMMGNDLPVGYDWVVVVRRHEPLILAEYQKLLMQMSLKLHKLWKKRADDAAKAAPVAEHENGLAEAGEGVGTDQTADRVKKPAVKHGHGRRGKNRGTDATGGNAGGKR